MSTIINAGRIAPLPKGLYDASTQYVKLDIVTYSNESYICTQACKGIAPTNGDYWQLLAGAAGGGKSIVSVTLTSSVGLVDTYTITYTDATTSTFQVTNGKDGEDGTDGTDGRGIISIAKTASNGLIDTYTITYTDRTTSTYQVTNGANGADGKGIVSITKTGTSGLVDTYTITYTDGTTSTYQVTNGEDGQDAEDDLMVVSSKISGSDDYYNLSYTWYELKTRVNNGHNKIYVLLTLDNDTTLKMPFNAIDTDDFLHFSTDVQEAGGRDVTHYDLLYGDDGFAILLATPLVQPVVKVSGATPTQTLAPNTFYKFTGAVTSLTLTLGTPIDGIANIYAFSFVAGAANPTISLPASVTIDGTPSIASGDYVEFSIMNNVAIFKVVTI
jgi:hypothetical protein